MSGGVQVYGPLAGFGRLAPCLSLKLDLAVDDSPTRLRVRNDMEFSLNAEVVF